jgi:hypothetical protein
LISRRPAPEGPTGVLGDVHPATPIRPVEVGVSIFRLSGAMKAGSYGTAFPPG